MQDCSVMVLNKELSSAGGTRGLPGKLAASSYREHNWCVLQLVTEQQ
jgi:hypothetical protein